MSKFSGRCDLADVIDICGGFERFKEKKPIIYVGESEKPIKCEKIQDIIPYYPYIITSSVSGDGKNTYWLSSKSWVDIEENLYGHQTIHDYYRDKLRKEMEKHSQNV